MTLTTKIYCSRQYILKKYYYSVVKKYGSALGGVRTPWTPPLSTPLLATKFLIKCTNRRLVCEDSLSFVAASLFSFLLLYCLSKSSIGLLLWDDCFAFSIYYHFPKLLLMYRNEKLL
jgi:hypothetical protein